MQSGQLATLNLQITEIIESKKAFQDHTIEIIRDEVKSLRKKNIDLQMELKKEILANFEIGEQVSNEVMRFFYSSGIENPQNFFKECMDMIASSKFAFPTKRGAGPLDELLPSNANSAGGLKALGSQFSGLQTTASFNVDTSTITTKPLKNSLGQAFRRKIDKTARVNIIDFEDSKLTSANDIYGPFDLENSTLGATQDYGFNSARGSIKLPPTNSGMDKRIVNTEGSVISLKDKKRSQPINLLIGQAFNEDDRPNSGGPQLRLQKLIKSNRNLATTTTPMNFQSKTGNLIKKKMGFILQKQIH